MKLKTISTTLSFIFVIALLLLSSRTAFVAESAPPKNVSVVASFRNCGTNDPDCLGPDRVLSVGGPFVDRQNGTQAYITSNGDFLLLTGLNQEIKYDLNDPTCGCPLAPSLPADGILHGPANLKVTGNLLTMPLPTAYQESVRTGEASFNLDGGKNRYLLRFYLPSNYSDTLPVRIKRLSNDIWEIEGTRDIITLGSGEQVGDIARLESYPAKGSSYDNRTSLGTYYAPFKITLTRLR